MKTGFSVRRFPGQEAGVVVVGASAAGLYAAYLLARRGVRVRVFEAEEKLGPPARTLIVTPYLENIFGGTPPYIVVNRTDALRLHSPSCSATVQLGRADFVIEREKLILWLLERARAVGVEIQQGHRFVGLEPDHGYAALRIEDARGRVTEVLARVVIGADGASSELAQQVCCDGRSHVFLRQAVVSMPAWASPTVTQIWFDPARTSYFFWLIPESRQRGVVGLIANNEEQARASLKAFMDDYNLQPLDYQEARVSCYSRRARPMHRVGETQVYLVGDAAAQVKMTTVGGVVTGLWGAQAAAQSILRGTSYVREALRLQKELTVHLLLRRILNRFAAEDYNGLLALLNRSAKGPVTSITRDEAARLLWKVGLAEPRFALVTAKALLARQIAHRCEDKVRFRESRAG